MFQCTENVSLSLSRVLGTMLIMGSSASACGDGGGRNDSIGSASASASGLTTDAGTTTPTPTTTTPTPTTTVETLGTEGAGSNSDGLTGAGTTESTTNATTSEVDLTEGEGTATSGGTSTGGDPCDGAIGGFDFSYLWVANTDQGSISKVNTMTLVEEARYWSDPQMSGLANPSRTSVSIDGHFVVVSNRDSGYVTKVAANVLDCIDKNDNGVIDTSPNKDTLLPFAEEECIIWSTQVSMPFSVGSGPRATAWSGGQFNPATCKYEKQKVWIGWLTGPGQATLARLNGETGAVEAMVPLPGWPLSADLVNGYAPYGAAVDAAGYVWTTPVFSDQVYRVDPVSLEVKVWVSPDGDRHYGMTLDAKGRVWFANHLGTHGGVSVFDPKSEVWTVIPGSGNNAYRGIAVDGNEQVWVANNVGGTNPCGMMQVAGDTLSVAQFHTFPQCEQPVGVSLDVDGDVWLVDYSGWAYEMDPINFKKNFLPIAGVHYTYSDMTGGGLVNVVTPQ